MDIKHPAWEQLPQLRRLWKEAFGDSDAFLDQFYRTAFAPERCVCATEGCEVAAAAYWFSCGEYAYIYAVATAKKYQGRGICHALMSKIHEILTQRGYAGCILVPGEESLRRFYLGMGYENFGGVYSFICEAGAPLPLRRIGTDEFAALRRRYLPEGGVIQEGENLAFLSCWAEFYEGSDTLVTAIREDGELKFMELLGSADAAPGIVAALGAESASFKIPGDNSFAMHKPLCCDQAPKYFGFCF